VKEEEVEEEEEALKSKVHTEIDEDVIEASGSLYTSSATDKRLSSNKGQIPLRDSDFESSGDKEIKQSSASIQWEIELKEVEKKKSPLREEEDNYEDDFEEVSEQI